VRIYSSVSGAFIDSVNTLAAPRGNLVVIDAACDQIVKIIELQERPLALSAAQ
jgi:hypothetical protein